MSDDDQTGSATGQPETDTGALLSRLRLIEDQPLDTRAAAYTQINDALQATLEGGDSHR